MWQSLSQAITMLPDGKDAEINGNPVYLATIKQGNRNILLIDKNDLPTLKATLDRDTGKAAQNGRFDNFDISAKAKSRKDGGRS